MVFSSLLFLFRFLPAVLILYYIAPRKLRNVILLLFSLFFYAWGEPKYVFLMLFTITMDFFIGKGIDKAKKEGNQKKAKRFLMISILVDLSILGFFKYADFLIGTVNTLTGAGIPLLGIPLPIGISFFTFQTMSYTIDVYKGSTEVQKNWIKYGTYVSMFPQLIAGPIVQYKTIAEQMEHRKENTSDFSEGIHRFMIGLGKKVLIANNIGALWDAIAVLPVDGLAAGTAWLGALAYTFQIYFDFSGYSDMAIGLGKMFGFHFLENFNYPYISKSITEFWRRWHISLSSWFKEYVYIPLGGNRCKIAKQIRNKGNAGYVRVKVDTENYRARRKETLENLAKNIAFKVKRTKKPVFLEPMNPYERRVIHSALQNDPLVSTHSEGEEPYRKVVVTLKKQ